jgi:hypothetical protein
MRLIRVVPNPYGGLLRIPVDADASAHSWAATAASLFTL